MMHCFEHIRLISISIVSDNSCLSSNSQGHPQRLNEQVEIAPHNMTLTSHLRFSKFYATTITFIPIQVNTLRLQSSLCIRVDLSVYLW